MAQPMICSSKPYVRWWWFSGIIHEREIDEQIEWISSNGFGGVEIAWVYPQPGANALDGPEFLSEGLTDRILHAIRMCREKSIGCDVTFGTLWPFGGSFVPERNASKTFTGSSPQRISHSWESRYDPVPSRILDHLDHTAVAEYSAHLLGHGFGTFSRQGPISFFCDSWEVDTQRLSTGDFKNAFYRSYAYDIAPFYDTLDVDTDVRFDYRRLLSETVLDNFYRTLVDIWHAENVTARIQCHGAPADILAAYALVDIPETETLLFDPDFALFASSAAALRNKPLVSSESFTCMYGWVPRPGKPPHLGTEQVEDLRCIADAQFAWGVNRVVWHGKPFSTKQKPQYFYAGVHVGPEGSLAGSYAPFNAYLELISRYMQIGTTESRLAVYLPLEDQWMSDELPVKLQKPSSRFYWELQECKIPERLLPWRPLWISGAFLPECFVENGAITNGYITFPELYIDARWMTFENLQEVVRLQENGAKLIVCRQPKEPGKNGHQEYRLLSEKLRVTGDTVPCAVLPLMSSSQPLDFWCRKDKNDFYFFISHPGTRNIRYPMTYGYGKTLYPASVDVRFNVGKKSISFRLEFSQRAGLLVKVDAQASIATVVDTEPT